MHPKCMDDFQEGDFHTKKKYKIRSGNKLLFEFNLNTLTLEYFA